MSSESKIAIVYYSKHHGNTLQLLEYISQEYLVDLIDASKSTQIDLSQYKVVGFASGIYFGKFHKSVVDTARKCLPDGVPVFFIYTYGSKQKNQTRAIAAAQQRMITIVTLVVYNFFFTSASCFDILQKISFTKIVATPRDRPAPPAITVTSSVPSTIPPINFGI